MASHNVLELQVPSWSTAGVSEPHLDSVTASINGVAGYLQTSPEFFLKRVLAATDLTAVYSLASAFRDNESGSNHNPEFIMLEWYQVGFSWQQLAAQAERLILSQLSQVHSTQFAYADLFYDSTGLDPHEASDAQLQVLAGQAISNTSDMSRSDYLDCIFVHNIEPNLADGVVTVYDFPACQAALAEVANNESGQAVAKRFEIYCNGIELANGYSELRNADELSERWKANNAERKQLNKAPVPEDTYLLDAMRHGLPKCAGVALGIDRLVMCALGADKLSDVMSFSFKRC